MKVKYTKTTFNLPFGGYGTYVQKMIKIDGEWMIINQKNTPVHNNEDKYKEVEAKVLYSNLT